ncbi:MAG TPA: response regulator [Opitutaceae bacterium]|nr:response regulator [Opitutaceae bacterium]
MNAEASILILEDERAQILALRSQLKGLGRLVEFTDPEPALEHARLHACDAAIVDVRMPRSTMDGLAFLHALREFDRDLAIIIRTGSEDGEIANRAIELRAIKRAIKSKTTLAELRKSTQEAILETRQRREMRQNADTTEATKKQLAEALGTYDLRLAAADLHRGLIFGLRDRLTALSSSASVLQADATKFGQAGIVDQGRRCADLASEMIGSINAFLDGTFGDGASASHASVNECLGALGQFFQGAERWAPEGKRVALRDLISDTFVACAPLELMNGLRHLAEFCLGRAKAGTKVSLSAAVVLSPGPLALRLSGAACVLNREAVRRDHPHVAFRLSAPLPPIGLEEIQSAFATGGPDPRVGNLAVLSKVLTAVRGGMLIDRAASDHLVLEPLFPIAV